MRRALKPTAIAAVAVLAAGTVAWVWATRSFYAALPVILGWSALAGISWGLLTDIQERRRARRLAAELFARDWARMPLRHPECLTRGPDKADRKHFACWEVDYARWEAGQEAEKP